ncbi:MAG: exo-beta-N-acetylmuramidase NamZ family protein [Vulcanimicrobiaceae bacterium]
MKRASFLAAAGAAALAPAVRAGTLPQASIKLGDDVLLRSAWHALRGRRVGIIANQASVTSRLVNIVDALHDHPGIHLTGIYAPEHGFRGGHTAGATFGSYRDPRTGLPVYSLYGADKEPSPAMLRDVDVMLFDIQDVGARAYTFVSTMAYAMRGVAGARKEFWVLDRPNPIGGELVEGPVLEPAYESFIGLYPIAMRHGMTIGELAQLFNDAFGIGARLHVVRMDGWKRSMLWPQTGLQWVQTSPNIPDWKTTVVYPCTGPISNAGINNGVGTTRPFRFAGAYELDPYPLARALQAYASPGVYFRPAYWSPLFGFWRGKTLAGVELDVYAPQRFLSIRSAVTILAAVRDVAPHFLRFDPHPFALDWGTDSLRVMLERGDSVDTIERAWQPRLEAFRRQRERSLLY